VSILLDETMELLQIKPDGIYVDGTLGGGGHAIHVCRQLSAQGRFFGIDQDGDALLAATNRLQQFRDKAVLLRGNYECMGELLAAHGVSLVDGILLDLGVSSYQLDQVERGFSYMEAEAPLDMRMDQRQPLTARDLVNLSSEAELFQMIRDYGEDRFAKNIAKHIVRVRSDHEIRTAGELNDVIAAAIPAKVRVRGGHPSKRTFQALRIALNRELLVLQNSLDQMIALLRPGGRIAVISFHSLEDRIVKNCFKRNENPCTCPSHFPICICGQTASGKVITKKPMLPTEREMSENPRSKSAKLRVFERI
jgi:16S rRNA (cytosine1402-N4)-methyltransferase